jgi:hypothetical protein
MPNLDGGHYFLTVLAPVRVDIMIDPDEIGRSRSHRQMLAQKLALIATGKQTAESPPNARPSPFSLNTLNHLARFVIINGPAFNGRMSGDALVSAVRAVNPLAPQPVDQLGTPFLLFAADIDAQAEGDALRAYTDALWATMKRDLVIIFGHCVGFDGIDSAEGFYAYIKRCQIETTMPFNDYWPDGLDVKDKSLEIGALKPVGIATVGATAIWLAILLLHGIFAVFGAHNAVAEWIAAAAMWGVIVVPLLIVLVLLMAWSLYRKVFRQGMTPFPTAPGADLPSVLKSLFIQQHFTRFAIEAQGLSDTDLHARFGAFLGATKPNDTAAPTQQAGEIRAPAAGWVQ